jgi:IS30 family transposase
MGRIGGIHEAGLSFREIARRFSQSNSTIQHGDLAQRRLRKA